MKKIFLLLTILCTATICAVAEERETQSPLYGEQIERRLAFADIEGFIYSNAYITLKSNKPGTWTDISKVKVVVYDSIGNVVYNKSLKNMYLYVFSEGTIKVAKQGFTKVKIYAKPGNGKCLAIIREREGVY